MNSFPSDPTLAAGAAVTAQTRVQDGEGISCGEFLRRARERRGLTLQQIAQGTKIPLRHLNALERDEFAVLPGGMYRRAEVRAYADAVGLDRHVALAWLDRALEQAMPRTASSVQASVPHPHPMFASGRTRVLMTAAVAVTTGAIALAMWVRQPGEGDIASLAAPDPLSRRTEPASVPPVSKQQPGMERSEGTTAAASRLETQLTVITEPAGARVTVNGVGWGITPVTIRYLAPGAMRVRVTRDGYRAEERLIQIEAGRPPTTLRIPIRTRTDEGGSLPDVLPEIDGTGN
jgi:helix-turn-helix protein/PEGA domain-containing protein